MTEEVKILKAKRLDLPEILNIYSHYVLNTSACLDETVPSIKVYEELFDLLEEKDLPFFVAKIDDKVVGYCYAKPYRERSAYRYTVETSIYIDQNYTGKGIARKIFTKVYEQVKEQGYKQMIAVVVNQSSGYSDRFHKDMGFVESGRLIKVGYKFGKWLDVFLLQKEI